MIASGALRREGGGAGQGRRARGGRESRDRRAASPSLTLTPEAVTRLGIETATAAVETVSRTRSVGGESHRAAGRSGDRHRAGRRHAAGGRRRRAAAGSRVDARPGRSSRCSPSSLPIANLDLEAERDAASGRSGADASRRSECSGSSGCSPTARPARARLKKRARNRRSRKRMPRPLGRARSEIGNSPTGTGGGVIVRSPIAGVLQSVAAAPGQTVAASAPLFEVVQTDGLWVRVQLFVGERNGVDTSQAGDGASASARRRVRRSPRCR